MDVLFGMLIGGGVVWAYYNLDWIRSKLGS